MGLGGGMGEGKEDGRCRESDQSDESLEKRREEFSYGTGN